MLFKSGYVSGFSIFSLLIHFLISLICLLIQCLTICIVQHTDYLTYSFLFPAQEEEEKELITFEEKLSMEYEAKRKIEQQKIRREFHNQKMNMDLFSYRMH